MNPMYMRWGKLYRGTPAEHAIEEAVAALGIPYRTQFAGFLYGLRFFPDFVFPTLGVVLEIDDDSHNRADKMEADAERTAEIKRVWGWDVCRTTNEAALTAPDEAVKTALASIGKWPLPARLPRVAQSLPRSKSAPQRAKRDAVSAARKVSRR